MVVLDVCLNNIYAFKNFHVNLTYPKKIVGSPLTDEHLPERPNFRYKKVNIILGANASGKTTFGCALKNIFNFIDKKNIEFLAETICDRSTAASFRLDLASKSNKFYRIDCKINPCSGEKYTAEDIALKIVEENIRKRDSYQSCLKRVEANQESSDVNYILELEKIQDLDWMFEYPKDTMRYLSFPKNDKKFRQVLENVLKALDPSILSVESSKDVENAYVVRMQDRAVILQDEAPFTTPLLSSGTKAGVEVAQVISSLIQKAYSFYYCDEKFPYVHSDIEKAAFSLMMDYIEPGDQIFFTTHNTDILEMNLPKHSFMFLHKDTSNTDCPIMCIDASTVLKRNTDSLKNAADNDLFACAPAVDLIYEIADL